MYLFIRNRETFSNHTRNKIFISSNEESNPSHGCRETRGWTIAPRNIPEWRFLFSEAAASCVWRVEDVVSRKVRWRNSQQDRCQKCVCAWLLLDLCFWASRLFLKRSDLASLAQSYVNLNVAATKINNDYTTESCCSNKNTPKEPGWQIMKSKHFFEKHNETFTSP